MCRIAEDRTIPLETASGEPGAVASSTPAPAPTIPPEPCPDHRAALQVYATFETDDKWSLLSSNCLWLNMEICLA